MLIKGVFNPFFSEMLDLISKRIIQPKVKMEKIGVDLLLDLIANKKDNKHIILNTELVKRESTNSNIE